MLNRSATTACIVAPIAAAFMMFATAEGALASAGHNGFGGMTGASHIPSNQMPSRTATSANAFHLAARQMAPGIQSSASMRTCKSDAKSKSDTTTTTARAITHTTVVSSDAAKTSSASSKPVTQTAMVEDNHVVTSNTTKSAATASSQTALSSMSSNSSADKKTKGTDPCAGPERSVGCKPPPTHVFDFSDFEALGHGVKVGAVDVGHGVATGATDVAHAAVSFYNGNVQDFKDWGHLVGTGAEKAGSGISTGAKAVGSSASFVASTAASAAKSVYNFVGGLF